MTGTGFPPCWLFGLWCPNTGSWSPLGGATSQCQNSYLWESSCQSLFPGASTTCALAPTVSQSQPLFPPEMLQDPLVILAQAPVESLFCALFQCTWNLVWTHQEWSLCFPKFCGAPELKPCWPSNPNALTVPAPDVRPSVWGACRGV